MALRGGRCLLDRRFADRGNDRSMFVSRAHGEDRRHVRRTAERGNDRVDSDPRDLEEIKWLRQRVRDLEEIKRLRQRVRDLEKIKRLRQRVRDLELKWEMCFKVTESVPIVWDDVNEEEERPFCHPHPRFFEPIYHESLIDDEPDSSNIVWDESDDEEGFGSVQEITDESIDQKSDEDLICNLNAYHLFEGTRDLERKLATQRGEHGYRISKFCDDSTVVTSLLATTNHITEGEVVVGDDVLVAGGEGAATNGNKSVLESPIKLPKFKGELNIAFQNLETNKYSKTIKGASQNLGYIRNSKFQTANEIGAPKTVDLKNDVNLRNFIYAGDNGKKENIRFSRDKGHISHDDICMTSMHDSSTPGHINIDGNSSGLHEDLSDFHVGAHKNLLNLPKEELCNHATKKNGSHTNKIVGPSFKSIRNNNSVANIGLENEVSSSNAHWLPIVNEIMFDAPFDPGGTSLKLGEMIHEKLRCLGES
ncbi:hypothetical protein HanPI659440_Chr13g0519381 [Helianthus annuus]|nr:hypothetical protein HanPI659440_Chr13g0519381 [Helianthus annuus]